MAFGGDEEIEGQNVHGSELEAYLYQYYYEVPLLLVEFFLNCV